MLLYHTLLFDLFVVIQDKLYKQSKKPYEEQLTFSVKVSRRIETS